MVGHQTIPTQFMFVNELAACSLACLLIVVSEVKFIAEGKEVSPERSSSTQHQANGGGHTGGSPKAQAPNESVLVHLKLDALGFNGLVCDGEAPDPPTDGKDCNRDSLVQRLLLLGSPITLFSA